MRRIVDTIFVVPGEDFAYSPAGLRLAAGEHDGAAQAARALSAELAAIEIAAADLGTVPEVAAFVAAALAARDSQSAGAAEEHRRRAELTARVQSVADLGERLLIDTERITRSGTPVVRSATAPRSWTRWAVPSPARVAERRGGT